MYGQEKRTIAPPKPADDDPEVDLDQWDDIVADKYKVPRTLMKAIRSQESGGNVNAVSPTGVKGRYQVTERTAKQYGLDRNDPFQQSVAAAKHLRNLYDQTDGADDDEKWLGSAAKYYGGDNAVKNGELSTGSLDGLSNPARYAEGIAKKWGELRRQERGEQPQTPQIAVGHDQNPKPLAQSPRLPVSPSPRKPSTSTPNVFNKTLPQDQRQATSDARKALDFRPAGGNVVKLTEDANRLSRQISPEVQQQVAQRDARLQQHRAAATQRGVIGQRARDLYQAGANIGQGAQQGFENLLTFSGLRDVANLSPAVKAQMAEGRLAQEATNQRMAEEQQANNSLASQLMRGAGQAAGSTAILAPVAMVGGVPGVMGAVGLQQDWERDPKGALLNTATAGLPIAAGRAISPVAGRLASRATPALQRPVQVGIEAGAGGLANTAQYTGTQAALGREINPEEALVQGITGAGLSGVMAPNLRQIQARNQARQALQNIPREPQAPMNLTPTTVGPTRRIPVTPDDVRRANTPLEKGTTEPLTTNDQPPTPPTPDDPISAALMDDPDLADVLNFAGIKKPAPKAAAAAKPARPQMAAADLRSQVDALKTEAVEAENAGNFEVARTKYRSAQQMLGEMIKGARRDRNAAELSRLVEEANAANRNWQMAGNRASRAAKERSQGVDQKPVLRSQVAENKGQLSVDRPVSDDQWFASLPQKRRDILEAHWQGQTPAQIQRSVKGAGYGEINGTINEYNQRGKQPDSAPTRDLTAPLPEAVEAAPRTTAEIPRVVPEEVQPTQQMRPRSTELPAPLTPPTNRIAEGVGGELQRYSKPLEGQPIEVPEKVQPVEAPSPAVNRQKKAVKAPEPVEETEVDFVALAEQSAAERAANRERSQRRKMTGNLSPIEYLKRKTNKQGFRVTDKGEARKLGSKEAGIVGLTNKRSKWSTHDAQVMLDEGGFAMPDGRAFTDPSVTENDMLTFLGDYGKQARQGTADLERRLMEEEEAYYRQQEENAPDPEAPNVQAQRERESLPPIERRRAVRDAVPRGQFGKLSESAYKRGDRESSLVENPQLRRLLDLPEMPPYHLPDAAINPKTGQPYVNPEWQSAAQDTLNALAAVGGKERSSQINFGQGDKGTRGEMGDLFLAVRKLAQKKGERVDPALAAAFKGTVEGARTAQAGYQEFSIDERVENIRNSMRGLIERGQLSRKEIQAHKAAFREIATEYGISQNQADKLFDGTKTEAAARAERGRAGQSADADQSRSESRSEPVVERVEQRATGTEGGGRAAVSEAEPVEAPKPTPKTEIEINSRMEEISSRRRRLTNIPVGEWLSESARTEVERLNAEETALRKQLAEMRRPAKEAAEREAEQARKIRQDEDVKRIASLPTFQKRNGWEIAKDGVNFIVRDPSTKEEIWKGSQLRRAREVADESKPEASKGATNETQPQAPDVADNPGANNPAGDEAAKARELARIDELVKQGLISKAMGEQKKAVIRNRTTPLGFAQKPSRFSFGELKDEPKGPVLGAGLGGLQKVLDKVKDAQSFGELPKTRADVENSPRFKKWFGDSKVVDEKGKPLVVYHGTPASFDVFDPATKGRASEHSTAKAGFFFSESPEVAEMFAEQTGTGSPNLMSVYLSIKNPLEMDAGEFSYLYVGGRKDFERRARAAQRAGYDGIRIVPDAWEMIGDEHEAVTYVAFHPNQIKSATGNSGAFSPESGSILGAGLGGLQGVNFRQAPVADRPLPASFNPQTWAKGAVKDLGKVQADPKRFAEMKTAVNKAVAAIQANKAFDFREAQAEIRNLAAAPKTRGQRVKEGVLSAASLPRQLLASGDLSAPLRQGAVLTLPPSQWGRATKATIRQFRALSNKQYEQIRRDIFNHPDHEAAEKANLYLATDKLSQGEEDFISRLPGKIPVLKEITGRSENAYKTYLDSLRMDTFASYKKTIDKTNLTADQKEAAYKAAADWINVATGRGSLGETFDKAANGLSAVFFAPRYTASRVQMLNPATYLKNLKAGNRQVFARQAADLAQFAGMVSATLLLAKGAGASVGTDPDDADFLKIKVGNTRYDFLAGLQQVMRLFYRTGKDVKRATLGQKREGKDDAFDIAARFGRSKLAPAPSYFVDMVTGKDYIGKKFEHGKAELDRVVPLMWRDFYDAYRREGWGGVGKMSPGFFGVSTTDYDRGKTPRRPIGAASRPSPPTPIGVTRTTN